MSLPPLPTTTLAIIINRVQRIGQILRHGEKVPDCLVRGGKNRHSLGMGKKFAQRANTRTLLAIALCSQGLSLLMWHLWGRGRLPIAHKTLTRVSGDAQSRNRPWGRSQYRRIRQSLRVLGVGGGGLGWGEKR